MNAFNRAFTIVGLIVLLVLGVFALLAPGAFIATLQDLANRAHVTLFPNMSDVVRLAIRAVFALTLILLLIALLYLEFRRPRPRTIEVAREQGSKIRVMNETVERKLQGQIEGLGEITQARVKVSEKGKAVVVRVEADTTRDADAIAKGADIAKVVSIVIQDQMGLTLAGRPDVVVKQTKAKTGKPQTTSLLSTAQPDALTAPDGHAEPAA